MSFHVSAGHLYVFLQKMPIQLLFPALNCVACYALFTNPGCTAEERGDNLLRSFCPVIFRSLEVTGILWA